ncbi:hypothetical protein IAT38_005397 [Cryptococcus sp. DSM 104549]
MIISITTPHKPNCPHSSSPLNPNHPPSSSPPLSSPTPYTHPLPFTAFAAGPSPNHTQSPNSPTFPPSFASHNPPHGHLPRQKISTRYQRPAKASAPSHAGATRDLFTDGTTPVTGALWRENLSRRFEERERRQKQRREKDLMQRRGLGDEVESVDDVEAERKELEEDEEIFRRIIVLQRRKEQHAILVSEEQETGGDDPNLPDFWEAELDALHREEQGLIQRLSDLPGPSGWTAPSPTRLVNIHGPPRGGDEGNEWDDELEWEAAQAEEAERAAEAEIARALEDAEMAQMEVRQQALAHQQGGGEGSGGGGMDQDMDMEVDWEAFDSMEIE